MKYSARKDMFLKHIIIAFTACLLIAGCGQEDFLNKLEDRITYTTTIKLSDLVDVEWDEVCFFKEEDDSIPVDAPSKFIEHRKLDASEIPLGQLNNTDYEAAFIFIKDKKVTQISFDRNNSIKKYDTIYSLNAEGNPKMKNLFCYSNKGATFLFQNGRLYIKED